MLRFSAFTAILCPDKLLPKGSCSTLCSAERQDYLPGFDPELILIMSEWQASNLRPHAPKACALPTALHPDIRRMSVCTGELFTR